MLSRLLNLLKEEDFQDPDAGLLNFPAYVYTYHPSKEYELREEIHQIKQQLTRPKAYQYCLVINVYDEMVEYLNNRKIGKNSLWEKMLEKEQENPEKVRRDLDRHLHSTDFKDHIVEKIKSHLQDDPNKKKSYVLVHGFGSVFPFLRVHKFLNMLESDIRNYKMIVFYPGTYEKNYYQMFGELESDSIYRGSCINELIRE